MQVITRDETEAGLCLTIAKEPGVWPRWQIHILKNEAGNLLSFFVLLYHEEGASAGRLDSVPRGILPFVMGVFGARPASVKSVFGSEAILGEPDDEDIRF